MIHKVNQMCPELIKRLSTLITSIFEDRPKYLDVGNNKSVKDFDDAIKSEYFLQDAKRF